MCIYEHMCTPPLCVAVNDFVMESILICDSLKIHISWWPIKCTESKNELKCILKGESCPALCVCLHSQFVNILMAVAHWAVKGHSHLWRSAGPDKVRLRSRSSYVSWRSVLCGLLSDYDVQSPQCTFQVSIFPPCLSVCCLSCPICETCWC